MRTTRQTSAITRTELFLRGIPRAFTLLPVGGGVFARRRLIRLSWPLFGSIGAR